jgi:zinc protease
MNAARVILAAALLCSAEGAAGQESSSNKGLDFPLRPYALKNGLKVILTEDDSLPLVSVIVGYAVGPVREQAGKSGLAYLMENLMFHGSENISPMQHINYIQRIGGEFNADTSFDKTYFYETVPSNQLALALWLESDRMGSLSITGSSVERAKETLRAEHRQRRINESYLESFFQFDRLLYPDFVYGHPLIGTEEDINAITEADVREFYSSYYVPNNAVLCISGSFDVPRTMELIARYFDSIPRGNEIPPPPSPKPAPDALQEMILQDSLVPSPAFHVGYRIGRVQAEDYYSLKILEAILIQGRSSRLYKRLVKRDRVAAYLDGGIEERGDQMVFKFFSISNNPVLFGLCRKAFASEITRLKTSLVSEDELRKAKTLLKRDYLNRLSTTLDKGLFLSERSLDGKALDHLGDDLRKYMSVTPMAVISLINRLFIPRNTVTLSVETK